MATASNSIVPPGFTGRSYRRAEKRLVLMPVTVSVTSVSSPLLWYEKAILALPTAMSSMPPPRPLLFQ